MADREDVERVRRYYEKILPFYEREAAAGSHLAFWRGLARRWRPASILEVGSGLGRVTRELSRHAPTVGIDICLEMLRRASRRLPARSRARFVAADMREVVFGCRFDLIVAPNDPFSHWTAIEDRRRALRCVADQLSQRGRLVLDGLHRSRDFDDPQRRIPHPGGVLHIGETWTPLRRRGDLWRVRYRYRDRGAGETFRALDASFSARAWNPATIRPLFASCGLAIEEIWGDFSRRPFRPDSRRLIVVARRRARFVHRQRRLREER